MESTADSMVGDSPLALEVADGHLLGGHVLALAFVEALETHRRGHVAVHGDLVGGGGGIAAPVGTDLDRLGIVVAIGADGVMRVAESGRTNNPQTIADNVVRDAAYVSQADDQTVVALRLFRRVG